MRCAEFVCKPYVCLRTYTQIYCTYIHVYNYICTNPVFFFRSARLNAGKNSKIIQLALNCFVFQALLKTCLKLRLFDYMYIYPIYVHISKHTYIHTWTQVTKEDIAKGFKQRFTGRYAHTREYVQKAMAKTDFKWVAKAQAHVALLPSRARASVYSWLLRAWNQTGSVSYVMIHCCWARIVHSLHRDTLKTIQGHKHALCQQSFTLSLW